MNEDKASVLSVKQRLQEEKRGSERFDEADLSGNRTDISWKSFFGAQFYNVYRRKTDEPTYRLIGSTESEFYTDRVSAADYQYKIVAVCSGCCKTVCHIDVRAD